MNKFRVVGCVFFFKLMTNTRFRSLAGDRRSQLSLVGWKEGYLLATPPNRFLPQDPLGSVAPFVYV